jgi:mannose-6-phosphate isomerase
MTAVTLLPSNQPPDRFYHGGPRIAAFRSEPPRGDRVPEDWVASTTTLAGEESLGLSVLSDGRLLRDVVQSEPDDWLVADHIARFGVDTKLLVKLLDAGQRLPVHAHPSAAFAHDRLGLHHGKAEAWFMLTEGDVFIGLTEELSHAEALGLVESQDVEALLGRMHRRHVLPGDTVYVPPGLLHAIGEGTFLVEVQEPEDLSILLEWRDFDIDGSLDGHLGLGFDTALDGVELAARDEDSIDALITSGGWGDSILTAGSEEFFRLGRHEIFGTVDLDPGFAVLVVTAGALDLTDAAGGSLMLPFGSTAVVPHTAGSISISGAGELLVCRPPTSRTGPGGR